MILPLQTMSCFLTSSPSGLISYCVHSCCLCFRLCCGYPSLTTLPLYFVALVCFSVPSTSNTSEKYLPSSEQAKSLIISSIHYVLPLHSCCHDNNFILICLFATCLPNQIISTIAGRNLVCFYLCYPSTCHGSWHIIGPPEILLNA